MRKKILIIFYLIIVHTNLFADDNKFDIGFNRFNGTWNFIEDFSYNLVGNWGNIFVTNNYKGTSIASIANSFRDDESFWAAYNYPFYKNIFFTLETKYNLISDQRIQNANKLQRLSGIAGTSGKIANLVEFKFLAGAETNTQATINSAGFLTKMNAKMSNLEIDGYNLNSTFNSELLYLKDKRQNKDIEVLANISKVFSSTDNFEFGVKYKLQGRNFLQFLNEKNPFAIETNSDNKISAILNGSFEIYKNFIVNLNSSVEDIIVNRYYMSEYDNINYSKVNKKYNELNANLKIDVDIFYDNFFQKIGMIFANKNEQNILKKRFEIENELFWNIQKLETQKDNNQLITNLFYNNNLNITKNDTLRTNISLTKTEYNTPSSLNNTDRDELNTRVAVAYLRRSSDILTLLINLNYYQNHLVFIKKEQSSQNNWNRRIALNTGIKIATDFLLYYPQFEVLANYTVYDFETSEQKPRSYSFRQISYKDSLQYVITSKYYFVNKISVRYYEQGKLFWNSFSELPQQSNIEISAFPMLNCKINENIQIGLGGRVFFLEYGNISNNGNAQNRNQIYSYSPEASFNIKINKLTLICYGWMEYKYQQNEFVGSIPNIFLQTSYNF